MAAAAAALWRGYQRLLARHPWKVQILTAGVGEPWDEPIQRMREVLSYLCNQASWLG